MHYFITGTDTEIGKTFTTCALLHAARAQGLRAVGYKPVAAGAVAGPRGWENEDAVALRAASTPGFTLAQINPVCLREPTAPQRAAALEGRTLTLPPLLAGYAALLPHAEVVLVEGVGGFCVPLGDTLDTTDLAAALDLPVLLVVGMRLGCINHALLTAQAIDQRGLKLAGWYANTLGPLGGFDDTLASLSQRLPAPLLGVLPRCEKGPAQAAATVRLPSRL